MHFKQELFDELLNQMWQRLDKMWLKGLTYQSGHGPEEISRRLLADPKSLLAEDELQDFSHVQKLLQEPDSTEACQLALNFSILYAQNLYDEYGTNLAELIKKHLNENKIELRFHAFDLTKLTRDGWIALRNVLLNFSIINLYFEGIYLHQEQYQEFFSFIESMPRLSILSISSNNNEFVVPLPNLLEVIGKVSKLEHLELNGCNITVEHINPLCNLITNFPATALALKNNSLHTFDVKNWVTFWSAVNSSKLKFLNLAGNKLAKTNEDSLWKIVLETLQDNFSLQDISFSEDQSFYPQIEKQLVRNRVLFVCQKEAQIFLHEIESSKKELLDDIDKIYTVVRKINNVLDKLQQALDLLQDKNSLNADQNRNQVLKLMDKLRWQKANLLVSLEENGRAVDTWLDIMPQSEHYRQSRMDAFEATYMQNLFASVEEYLNSAKTLAEKEGLQQKHPVFRRIAFLQALPCLLEEQQLTLPHDQKVKMQLISLTKDQQLIFDNILFAAARGHERDLNWLSTNDERLALLQYVVLLDIASTESVLFSGLNKRKVFLRKINLLTVNNINASSCRNEREQKLLFNLWSNFMVIADRIGDDYQDDDFEVIGKEILVQHQQDLKLVKAISELSAKTLTKDQREPETDFFKGKKRLASSVIPAAISGTQSPVEKPPLLELEHVNAENFTKGIRNDRY